MRPSAASSARRSGIRTFIVRPPADKAAAEQAGSEGPEEGGGRRSGKETGTTGGGPASSRPERRGNGNAQVLRPLVMGYPTFLSQSLVPSASSASTTFSFRVVQNIYPNSAAFPRRDDLPDDRHARPCREQSSAGDGVGSRDRPRISPPVQVSDYREQVRRRYVDCARWCDSQRSAAWRREITIGKGPI